MLRNKIFDWTQSLSFFLRTVLLVNLIYALSILLHVPLAYRQLVISAVRAPMNLRYYMRLKISLYVSIEQPESSVLLRAYGVVLGTVSLV
jgi:hypothetical protein